MAARRALGALLLNAVTANAVTYTTSSGPAFWTVTSRFVDVVSASPYTYNDGEVTQYMSSDTRTVKSTVTPTATPTFTSTYSGYYDDLDIVYAYYPTGAVAESDLEPAYDYSATRTSSTAYSYTYIYFSMPVTMTAPASCPTPCMCT